MYTMHAILSPVKQKNISLMAQQRFCNKLLAFWPALKGSLPQVCKPCIRPNCRACASGKKHPNHLLAFTQNARRRCLYLPVEMVRSLKRALANGRHVEQVLYELGPALLRASRVRT